MMQRTALGEAPNVAVPVPSPQQYSYETAFLTFQRTLTANQALNDLTIQNTNDGDFLWDSIFGIKTGNYTLRLRLPNGRYLTPTQVQDRNMVGTAQFKFPIPVVQVVAQNGYVGLDITDVTGADNTIELMLGGTLRRRALAA